MGWDSPDVSIGLSIGYLNTLMRYYLHLDPDSLSDVEWAWEIRFLREIREEEARRNE